MVFLTKVYIITRKSRDSFINYQYNCLNLYKKYVLIVLTEQEHIMNVLPRDSKSKLLKGDMIHPLRYFNKK